MDVKVLVQRWNDEQAAMADAELLQHDHCAARKHQDAAQSIESELATAGLNIRDLVCP